MAPIIEAHTKDVHSFWQICQLVFLIIVYSSPFLTGSFYRIDWYWYLAIFTFMVCIGNIILGKTEPTSSMKTLGELQRNLAVILGFQLVISFFIVFANC